MAIIVEGIAVVFPFALTKTKYQGGWEQFKKDFPKEKVMYCSDEELIGILFKPEEETLNRVSAYLETLEKRGLTITQGNEFADVAVLDQLLDLPEGMQCPWLSMYTAVAGIPEKGIHFDFSFGKDVAPEALLAPLEEVGKVEAKAEREALAAEQTALRAELARMKAEHEAAERAAAGETDELTEDTQSEEAESAEGEGMQVAAMTAGVSDNVVGKTEEIAEVVAGGDSIAVDTSDEDEAERSEEEAEESIYEELSPEELEKLPRVKACRLINGISKGLSLPKHWDYEKSWTKRYGIVVPDTPFVPQNKA